MLNKIIKYFLENKLVTGLILIVIIVWGIATSPFNWKIPFIPSDSVAVDAIPDIGENQQIVFTQWQGRSPQDIEDQISYPLTTYLLGIPGVKSVRSNSIFGFSSIYIIFEDDVEFYWSRSRILEKLNSLPNSLLPENVKPSLGPDATALGQVYWYTVEGRDKDGNPTGGWDLQEIRTAQDFYIKYGLNAVKGVSEVASIGGFVKEYQVDVNPDALKAYNISLMQVMTAVQKSNKDVGAKTIEINQAEYLVRGLGYVKKVEDIELAVVAVKDNVPIRIKDIGKVALGPETRRGILDKGGAEAVGGVVIARYGSNPLEVINGVKTKINEIASGLPKKTLANGVVSQLTIIPFYDRTELIHETIGTLETALSHEVLISIIVVLLLVFNLRASLIISSLLPVGVLLTFIVMRYAGVDANVVALSGIAIAIGVMVDVGIIFIENIIRHLEMPENKGASGAKLMHVIYESTTEVVSAITTALATTVVSFIPVFMMESAEGKLFRPLAFTKTFALLGAFVLGLVVLPSLANYIFGIDFDKKRVKRFWGYVFISIGILLSIYFKIWLPIALTLMGIYDLFNHKIPQKYQSYTKHFNLVLVLFIVSFFLTQEWMPLGPQISVIGNYLFVIVLLGIILSALLAIVKYYEPVLRWCLENKGKFLILPLVTLLFGIIIWIGFESTFGVVAKGFDKLGYNIRSTKIWSAPSHAFPGIGSEFMPTLNEGSYLLMPTSMPHAGVEQNRKVVGQLDMILNHIPEVDMAVGKLGRVESALDPAPISMYENIINYKPEYILDDKGHRMRFKTDDKNRFITKSGDSLTHDEALKQAITIKNLIPDDDGTFYRNWRDIIKSPNDIWNEIVKASKIPGVTSAPKLQPIETRLVMLQTGMRAPMGIKVFGPDLKTIEEFGLQLESIIKEVPSVKKEAVFADRIVGKPYLHLNIDREKIARFGLNVEDIQQTIETAIGGMKIASTVEGRERYPIRVRYPRELRDSPEALGKILVATPTGAQIPLGQLVQFEYKKGPQAIKSEDTFLVGFVLFDKNDGYAEVDVVNDAQKAIQAKIDSGELKVPQGINYKFSGTYENQIRAMKRLSIVIPICLGVIFLLLYFQFKTIIASSIHFSGVFVAFAGGFIMLWLYGQDWFMNFAVADVNMRDLFQMHPINLSVAVWVGFIALFGIATDDGVIMGSYIHQVFEEKNPQTVTEVRNAVVEAGKMRVRPAVMTAATTIIALLPVLTSTGKGSDIMIPMAIPTFGGMTIQIMTMFVVPVLQAYWRETVIKNKEKEMRKILIISLLLIAFNVKAQSINEFYTIASENNPELKAKYKEFEASLQKVAQVSALPDPSLTMEYLVSPSSPENMRLTLSQMFPWFGTLKAQKSASTLLAESKYQAFLNSKNQLFYQVATVYYPLYELKKMKNIEQENIRILESYKNIANAKFQNGSTGLVDVLRVDIMIKEAQTNLDILDKQEPALKSWLNSILNRKYDEKIEMVQELNIVSLPLGYRKEAIATNPLLQELELKKQASEVGIEIARKQGLPNFGVGVEYVFMGSGMNNAGKDMIMPMVTVSLPIFRKKYNAAVSEAKLMQESYSFQKEASENKLNGTYYKLVYELEKERDLLALYEGQVATLSKSLNLLFSYYSNSNKDFEEVLRMQQELLKYQKMKLSSTSTFYIKLAELDYLTAKQF